METKDHRKPPSRKKSRPVFYLMILVGFLFLTTVCFFAFNRWKIIITINGDSQTQIEYKDTYQDKGATAIYRSSLLPFIQKDVKVNIDKNSVNTELLGTYTVIYKAEYKNVKNEASRTVKVVDTTPPQLTLVENPDSYTPYNHEYEEEGYQAIDNHDGDLSEKVERTVKDDEVIYTVKDTSGNQAKKKRKIRYDDRKGPEISFPDGTDLILYKGTAFTDSYTAIDDCDGDVTSLVKVEGDVDVNICGTYIRTYTVSDSHGNTTSLNRNITIRMRPINNPSSSDGPKTIFLTFDDGPGESTGRLLDILDRYNVKATFFTTSMYGYTDYIAQEAQRGHTVCVHTYSHNYASIYQNTDAYWQDYEAQKSIIEQQTGSSNNLFRFPGGSSNTVSANYSSGIMSKLVEQSYEKCLVYFDWNVSSGDAGGSTDTNVIIDNIRNGISRNTAAGVPSIVLQHDYKPYTVDAVEPVIVWALENGYTFKALSDTSYYVHHGINN